MDGKLAVVGAKATGQFGVAHEKAPKTLERKVYEKVSIAF